MHNRCILPGVSQLEIVQIEGLGLLPLANTKRHLQAIDSQEAQSTVFEISHETISVST